MSDSIMSTTAEEIAGTIGRRVRSPRFGRRTVSITDHGASPDGRTDCTDALDAAIRTVSTAGGGRVLVPPGRFLTGAVHLLDRTELHLSAGAVLEFSRDPRDYLPLVPTRYEGVECFNYSPFVYANGRTDIAITGTGVLDGRADENHWWDWARGPAPVEAPAKAELLAFAEAGIPVADRRFGDRAPLRPSMVQFVDCHNVAVRDVTVRNAPMWVLHPVLCSNVTIAGVTVRSHGPNNDGCDPECCADVLITDCTFDTGDDCIAIKAGKGTDGRRVGRPSTDILITDCRMRAGHGGVTLGSETSGGIGRVVARRCTMDSPALKRALRIKSNPDRGGTVTDVHFTDLEIGSVTQSVIEIALDYENLHTGCHPPQVGGLTFRRIHAARADRALRLIGLPDAPIVDIRLVDCRFDRMRSADLIAHTRGLQFQGMPER